MNGKGEMVFESRMYLSYLFLQGFHQRYEELINAVSSYIANYKSFMTSFPTEEIRRRKQYFTEVIKRNFGSVIFTLETILSQLGEKNKFTKELEELKMIYRKKIIFLDTIPLEYLLLIQENLSKIAGALLLKSIIDYYSTQAEKKSWLGHAQPSTDEEFGYGEYYEE